MFWPVNLYAFDFNWFLLLYTTNSLSKMKLIKCLSSQLMDEKIFCSNLNFFLLEWTSLIMQNLCVCFKLNVFQIVFIEKSLWLLMDSNEISLVFFFQSRGLWQSSATYLFWHYPNIFTSNAHILVCRLMNYERIFWHLTQYKQRCV